ncbi:MAG: hypothetical protein RJP95_04465 [Pirellulales bacterium]
MGQRPQRRTAITFSEGAKIKVKTMTNVQLEIEATIHASEESSLSCRWDTVWSLSTKTLNGASVNLLLGDKRPFNNEL